MFWSFDTFLRRCTWRFLHFFIFPIFVGHSSNSSRNTAERTLSFPYWKTWLKFWFFKFPDSCWKNLILRWSHCVTDFIEADIVNMSISIKNYKNNVKRLKKNTSKNKKKPTLKIYPQPTKKLDCRLSSKRVNSIKEGGQNPHAMQANVVVLNNTDQNEKVFSNMHVLTRQNYEVCKRLKTSQNHESHSAYRVFLFLFFCSSFFFFFFFLYSEKLIFFSRFTLFIFMSTSN